MKTPSAFYTDCFYIGKYISIELTIKSGVSDVQK
jgi:hypothetical protein